jgi:butyrate kinase
MKADSGGVMTIADIAKAFGTIPHGALKQCLQRKCVSERIASHLGLMYNDWWITIRMGSSHSIQIQLKRGVNQGNPLFPLLFNVTLNPIKEAINSGTTGIDMARKNVSILAFSDDIVLISKNTTTAQEQLTMFSSFLTQLGMRKSSISGDEEVFHLLN